MSVTSCCVDIVYMTYYFFFFFFFQAEDGIRDRTVTGVQTCALPIYYFWTKQTTLGWQNIKPVIITVDLGRSMAITGASFNTDRKSVVVGKECRSRWSEDH